MSSNSNSIQWFVLRDLKRSNASVKAWQQLSQEGFEVFTPMHWKISQRMGKMIRKYQPVISDLLFVHSDRERLDKIIQKTETLQYRFLKNTHSAPMTVRESEMDRFINAVKSSESVNYYSPDEASDILKGKKIRIIGGLLDGYEGILKTTRGSRIKRLIIELPQLVIAALEVEPEYIEIIE